MAERQRAYPLSLSHHSSSFGSGMKISERLRFSMNLLAILLVSTYTHIKGSSCIVLFHREDLRRVWL